MLGITLNESPPNLTSIALKHGEAGFEDHRVRVGAQRRGKTRLRLLQCALAVFTEKGPDVAFIDDFIAAAGVSRGTFYNHFKTNGTYFDISATGGLTQVIEGKRRWQTSDR